SASHPSRHAVRGDIADVVDPAVRAGRRGRAAPGEHRAMNWLAHEWTLLWRSRPSAASLLLLMALATWAVVGGIQEVGRQSQAIERLGPLQEQDVAAVANRYADSGNAGSAAYYTFYSTWDPPSPAAFAALGLRDVA